MPSRTTIFLLGILAAWVAIVVPIAAADGFVVADGPPWPIVVAVVVPLVVFAGLYRIAPVRTHLLALDPRLMVAMQLWRVLGAAFLFGWAGDELDAGFAIPAGIGDIATGIAALGLLTVVLGGTMNQTHLRLFTALGVGDFVIALATGALVRPDGLEELPWVLFPALAVPFFSIVHILNWVQLSRGATRATMVEPVRTVTVPAGSSH